MAYFGTYDRIDDTGNETDSQLGVPVGILVTATPHNPLQNEIPMTKCDDVIENHFTLQRAVLFYYGNTICRPSS